MKILLTGGCGFIGSNFARFVLRERPDDQLTNLDKLTYSGRRENLQDLESNPATRERYRFVEGDINDAKLVTQLVADCDAVVHMAAESHVDRSIHDARPFVVTNVLGTQTLLDALHKAESKTPRTNGPRVFLHVSTDEVFGDLPLDQPDRKFTESTPIAPNSPYAASKAGSDLVAESYHHTFGLDIRITNCSNNFGPYQFPEKVIPLFITNLIQEKKVPLYGDGKNIRDWLHVEDHCEALLAVLDRGKAGQRYCIGGNNERSNLELTHQILEAMNLGTEWIKPVEDRLGHDRRYAIDATKMRDDLGWNPTRSAWPEALHATLDWYRNHAPWWEPLKNQT